MLLRQSIIIERTRNIRTKCCLDIKTTTIFLDHLKSYLQFLILCCANLELMEFEFTCNSTSPNEYVTNLDFIIVSIVDHLKLLYRGSKRLKIRIEFTANFEEVMFEVNLGIF